MSIDLVIGLLALAVSLIAGIATGVALRAAKTSQDSRFATLSRGHDPFAR